MTTPSPTTDTPTPEAMEAATNLTDQARYADGSPCGPPFKILRHKSKITAVAIAFDTFAAARAKAALAEKERELSEAQAEIKRLRELFRIDGEQHSRHVRELLKQQDTRLAKYAETARERMRERDKARAECERLRALTEAHSFDSNLETQLDRFEEALAPPTPADLVERALEIWRKWWNPGGTSVQMIEDIAAALAAVREDATRRAYAQCADIAHKYRSEAALERHKTTDGEEKACWLWAFDTSNGIEREIRALPNTTAETGDKR